MSIGIGTFRKKTNGTYTLNQLHYSVSLGRQEYNGDPFCIAFGENISDVFGLGNAVNRSSPVQVGSGIGTGPRRFVDGSYATFATPATQAASFFIDDDNNLFSYGNDTFGWQGRSGALTNQIAGSWDRVRAGGDRYCFGIKTDETLWSWGKNTQGQLGQNDNIPRSSPALIPGDWVDVSVPSQGIDNRRVIFGFKKDPINSLWVWGNNYLGMNGLHDGDNINRSSPTQIPGNWIKLMQNDSGNVYAINNAQQLFGWGPAGNGQLGGNHVVPRSSPVFIMSDVDQMYPTGNGAFCLAKHVDGTLWAWGNNGSGQLGQADFMPRSSPVMIPGAWDNIVSRGSTVLAFGQNTDTIWSWGAQNNNMNGNSHGSEDKPQRVYGEFDRRYGLTTNGRTAFAVKTGQGDATDGLYVWGLGNFGQTGLNNTATIGLPTKVISLSDLSIRMPLNRPINMGEGADNQRNTFIFAGF